MSPRNASAARALEVVHTTDTDHAKTYLDAIGKERKAEVGSIVAAWETGHAFRTYDDPVSQISALTGVGENYIRMRVRLAGSFTRNQLTEGIERSGATHFTAFYSWAFHTSTHRNNQMGKHRSVHIPATHWKYFESYEIDVSAAVKEMLEVISPAELHALLRKWVPDEA
jgi:hypothetical protein